MAYDRNNIFAKILRGEIPCKKVYEDEFTFAFHDINPQAPTHVLAVPKGEYVSWVDFSASAPPELIVGFVRGVGKLAKQLGLEDAGFRILTNHGADGEQTVPHIHLHLFGGKRLGAMLVK